MLRLGLKSCITLAIFSTILTINAVSPAFANPQLIAPNVLQSIGNSQSATFDPDYPCGTKVPGFPPRPQLQSEINLRTRGVLAIGPKQDDPSVPPSANFRLSSPGIISALNPQPLPPGVCKNVNLPLGN